VLGCFVYLVYGGGKIDYDGLSWLGLVVVGGGGGVVENISL